MFITDRFEPGAYDCFVIGSGPAGLTAAMALGSAGRRVLVFESGDADVPRNELSNTVGYGHYSGQYWNLHWIRALGGTSNVWTGWCVTQREIDLDIPVVGVRWPIARAELVPYWQKAASILDRDPRFIDYERPLLPGFTYRSVMTAAPTRFGRKYGGELRAEGPVDVALGRTVVALDANASRSLITAIEYVDHALEMRRTLVVLPKQTVVVAAGAMGNAQLLMQPRVDGAAPVGNESGLVGLYLMEHPEFHNAGECVTDAEMDQFWPKENTGTGMHTVVADRALSIERGLYGCSLQCARKTADHDMARFLSAQYGRPCFHYEITARGEMLPSPRNRVVPTAEKNRWGQHRLAAHCVLDSRDFQNVEQTLRVFGETLIRLGRGRVRLNNDRIYKDAWGQGHTLGTTRMGASRDNSVVDANCRVHGYDNLFVGGSSVFPSGGYANPTLTIVALALRMADTIAKTR